MRFFNHNDVPIKSDDRVFKVPVVGKAIGAAVYLGLIVAFHKFWFSSGYSTGYWIVFWLVFMGWLIGLITLRAALKPTNWLLRCNKTGLLINYRSYWNWKMPSEDVQAVSLEYSEIAWVRTAKERRIIDMGGAASAVLDFLDLCLVNPDTTDLEKQLDAEQKRPASHWRVLSYPVEVLPGGIIRLKWENAGGGAFSNPKQALKWLSRYVKVAAEESTEANLTHQSHLAPLEEDAKILKLAKSGNRIGAISLTREIYGSTLTEAVAFVDKLTGENQNQKKRSLQ